MTINIVHIYYDILNLYGESGNVKVMKKYLEDLGIKVNIKFITLNDEINLDNIDLLYIGCGTENNQDLILNHLKKYKRNITEFIENNKFIISTGNSFELFGKYINTKEALSIFNYKAKRIPFRIVDECLFKSNLIDDKILGFQNRDSILEEVSTPLFSVIKGTGNSVKDSFEGYTYKNFYGTYLVGPLLVRNPYLLTFLMNKMIKEKDPNFEIKQANLELEINAYNEFIKNKNL